MKLPKKAKPIMRSPRVANGRSVNTGVKPQSFCDTGPCGPCIGGWKTCGIGRHSQNCPC